MGDLPSIRVKNFFTNFCELANYTNRIVKLISVIRLNTIRLARHSCKNVNLINHTHNPVTSLLPALGNFVSTNKITMTHTYNITGMTCTGCLAKVQGLLQQVPDIEKVEISLAEGTADITMKKHVATADLQQALTDYPKYQLSEAVTHHHQMSTDIANADNRTWLQTYKPILLIFGYLMAASLIAGYHGGFNIMTMMRVFMSGFFLVFSFFKLLDIRGFADSYRMYDIVAKRWSGWGFVYVFVELFLGIAFALNLAPVVVNAIMIVVMTISLIGVFQSVFNKRQIRCACLGAVFNLPMSTVTIIEDGLMIVMGIAMLGLM